jgi:hypothetical protein
MANKSVKQLKRGTPKTSIRTPVMAKYELEEEVGP